MEEGSRWSLLTDGGEESFSHLEAFVSSFTLQGTNSQTKTYNQSRHFKLSLLVVEAESASSLTFSPLTPRPPWKQKDTRQHFQLNRPKNKNRTKRFQIYQCRQSAHQRHPVFNDSLNFSKGFIIMLWDFGCILPSFQGNQPDQDLRCCPATQRKSLQAT